MKLTTNITSNNELKETMKETLAFLADTLKNTLGPYGTTTIIQDQYLNHQITKDGYSLLKKIIIKEDAGRTILDMVKAISRTLVRKVGDGSTSSIIIANSLYSALSEIMDEYKIPPKNLLDLLDKLTDLVSEEINNMAKPISDDMEELKYIAAVSTNNDLDYGKLVTEIFQQVGKFGFIDLKKSKNEKTYYEVTRGIELNRGFILPSMANQPDKKTCEFNDCRVLLVHGVINETDLDDMADIIGRTCYQKTSPLCIIAQGFDTSFNSSLYVNLNKKDPIPVVAVDLAMNNKSNQDRLNDIAIAIGATIVDKMSGDTFQDFDLDKLGKVNRLVATEKFCRLIEGHGSEEEIKARVNLIQEELDEKTRHEGHIEYDHDVYELRKRIAHLQSTLAVLYVGGKSEDSKDTDKYLLEDAVFACRSALNYGYIPGGNLVVPVVLTDKYDDVLAKLLVNTKFKKDFIEKVLHAVRNAFLMSYVAVLNNCYYDIDECKTIAEKCVNEHVFFNLKEDVEESMDETHIINSAETDIEILKSAISIIGLMATSNQFISISPLFH